MSLASKKRKFVDIPIPPVRTDEILNLSGCNSITPPISKERKLGLVHRQLTSILDEVDKLKKRIERILKDG